MAVPRRRFGRGRCCDRDLYVEREMIPSISIGITSLRLLTFFVVVLILFGLTKLWWGR